ncbi:MAG: I78 family peptidase inhibitor [Pseudomonadota bacterium]
MRFAIGVALLVFALSGCKSETESNGENAADLCGAASLQDRVGQPVSEFDFDADARVIPPDMAVTQDFRPERLNVELDGDGTITRIACG